MKTLKFLILFTTIFSLIIVSGCKKDEDTDPGTNTPEYQAKTVAIPDAMSQSDDPGAQMATSYINLVNSMANYGSMMTPPGKSTPISGLKDGGTETYTWDVNDASGIYTVTLRITETTSTYTWDLSITGTLDGHTYTNFTYIHAEEAKDGSSSTFTLYDWEDSGILMTISWYEQSNGSFTFSFEMPDDLKLTVIANPDGSGSIEMKEWENNQYVLTFKAVWDSTGHGEWWEYYNGTLSDQGAW